MSLSQNTENIEFLMDEVDQYIENVFEVINKLSL